VQAKINICESEDEEKVEENEEMVEKVEVEVEDVEMKDQQLEYLLEPIIPALGKLEVEF